MVCAMTVLRLSVTSARQALSTVREKHGDRLASVIHLAVYYDFSGEPSPLYQTLTVEGTRRLLRELQKFQTEQFIFSSSLLVMKPAEEGEIITESSPTEAEWDYPGSKLEAEKAIEEERGAISSVILRIAGVYDEDCYSIPIAQHIRRILRSSSKANSFPAILSMVSPLSISTTSACGSWWSIATYLVSGNSC